MPIEPAKMNVSHPDPKLASQKAIGRAVRKVLADAAAHGWSTTKSNNEMEKVLRNLRLTYMDSHKAADPSEIAPGTNSEPALDSDKLTQIVVAACLRGTIDPAELRTVARAARLAAAMPSMGRIGLTKRRPPKLRVPQPL
ncbi:hypothetical protein OIU34_37005 [Pararhizobium sp. BT-229]|uniref:hypothetical protein n=1 Tax=Pararhizobium sp. BT-229 TaxID=2986923 RepID=UPI0021F74563|nr:hypothetical protein [Pararhizobium sp. BT-229]MCV9967435.1 hypothetical protein [Pararhizobium sp. BT-229]